MIFIRAVDPWLKPCEIIKTEERCTSPDATSEVKVESIIEEAVDSKTPVFSLTLDEPEIDVLPEERHTDSEEGVDTLSTALSSEETTTFDDSIMSDSSEARSQTPGVNYDVLLQSIDEDVDEEEELQFVGRDNMQVSSTSLSEIEDTEEELVQETEELILNSTKTIEPQTSLLFVSSTVASKVPWARVVDESVYANTAQSSSPESNSESDTDVVLEVIPSRRQPQHTSRSEMRRLQELAEDYMANAIWSEAEDTSDSADEMLDPLSEHESENSSSAGSAVELDLEASDSDIDDDYELSMQQQMEEADFQLGGRAGLKLSDILDGPISDMENYEPYSYDDELYALTHGSGGKKRGLNKFIDDLDLSDEELEATLVHQWKQDRMSKRNKKRERQALHQAGIIGKRAKRAKAAHQVTDAGRSSNLEQYHVQIRRFCSHEDYFGIEQLPLPTMDKATRRAVHLVSQLYGLKSSSQGSGKRRYITLYKTGRSTRMPEQELIDRVLYQAKRSLGVNPKYHNNLKQEPKMKMKNGSRSQMGGKLRDGDVVGGNAPELDSTNKGRVMLEKLGWLQGSGLGAVGNGISIPIFATIKNTKYGLGN